MYVRWVETTLKDDLEYYPRVEKKPLKRLSYVKIELILL